jgi:hypothetical protein
MKSNLTKLLVVALAFLILASLFARSLYDRNKKPLFRFNPASITWMKIVANDGTSIVLKKTNGLWLMNGLKGALAEEQKVEGNINMIRNFRADDIVSKSPNRFSLYEVDEASATRVYFNSKPGITNQGFFIGKDTPDNNNSHMRKFGSDRTLRQKGGYLRYQFDTNPQNWKKRTVFNTSPLLELVRITYSNHTLLPESFKISLEERKGRWIITYPKKTDLSDQFQRQLPYMARHVRTLEEITNAGSPAMATNLAKQFSEPIAVIRLKFKQMKNEQVLTIGKRPEGEMAYTGRLEGAEPRYFVLTDSAVENVIKPFVEIAKEKPSKKKNPSQKEKE